MESVIDVNGKKWPCYKTGGSLLRYLRAVKERGLADADPADQYEASVLFLLCCVQSACEQEGREAPPSDLQTFLDMFTQDVVLAFTREQAAQLGAEKKTE